MFDLLVHPFRRTGSVLIVVLGVYMVIQSAGGRAQMVFGRMHVPRQDNHLRSAPCALRPS